ncbi:unnamed protein product [Adineta ricciae]|uniref:Uncharacterized protein n=1 Tax=Adineta ricciae TaxID=249248 RepID=A0A813Q1E0_ADIRI|nr:unnamed protein product [Adineta ricciae]CAF1139530.1 unnamed protein product [Adineta ricciae]
MADEFDPLKQDSIKPATENLYSTVQKSTANKDDLLRPQHEIVMKPEQVATDKPTEESPSSPIYHKLDFTSNAAKAPVRTATTQDTPESSSSPSAATQKPSPNIPPPMAKVNEDIDTSYWENSQYYEEHGYETGPPPAYYPEEYYEEESGSKRRMISATIDRIVQRFPTLGLFYKPSHNSESYTTEYAGQEYVEEVDDDQAPQLVDGNTLERELTADELALGGRYSNKARTQIIELQKKPQTQPVDVSIHHDTYTIYSCDVGRSVIEIFDMYGKLQHVIDDQTMVKFQPTAIAVAFDGTVIVGSHFNHRFHMYSPLEPTEDESNPSNAKAQSIYHYQQFKLGGPGSNLHEFQHPAGLSIDYNDGYLYICDRGNYRIQVLRPEGVCERVMELYLQEEEEIIHIAPNQIAHQQIGENVVCLIGSGDAICFIPKYSDGEVYVEPLYIVDNNGVGLQGASGIAIDCNDRIFISDTGHHRIVICTPEGGYITHFGSEGSGPGELKRPCGLDITADGTVVVADGGNGRLQLFGSVRERTAEETKPTEEKKTSTEKSTNPFA